MRISGHRSALDAVRVAVAAEEAGVHEVWLTEDYLERGIFTVAGAVAAATSRVTIGLGVVNPFSRHPALTAMEVAALDEIAGGRAILALGGSNERWMNEWLGIEFAKPLSAVREARRIIGDLLTKGAVDLDGQRFRVNARMSFQPMYHTAVWFGVKGIRGLEAARDEADGVILSVLSSPAYVAWVRGIVGRDVRLGAFVEVVVSEDGSAARDSVREFVARFVGMHGDQPITRMAGLDADTARRFRVALLAGRPDANAVTAEMIDTLVLAGTSDRCAAGFLRFAAAGLDTLIVGDRPEVSVVNAVATATSCWTLAGFDLA